MAALFESLKRSKWIKMSMCILVFQTLKRGMFGFVVPCSDSVKTISSVKSCPRNENEYRNAVRRMECSEKNHSCKSFEYHCVINDWINDTIEVCAPSLLIVGGVCTEFNLDEMSIRGSFLTNCTAFDVPCPLTYKSTTSYKYSGCYLNLKRGQPTLEQTNFTSSEGMRKGNDESHTLMVSITVVTTLVLCIIIVLLYMCFFRKHRHKCAFCSHKTDKGGNVAFSEPDGDD